MAGRPVDGQLATSNIVTNNYLYQAYYWAVKFKKKKHFKKAEIYAKDGKCGAFSCCKYYLKFDFANILL